MAQEEAVNPQKFRASNFDEHIALKRERVEVLKEVYKELLLDISKKDLERDEQGRYLITLEIGCGHGHWLSAYAARYPTQLCIGMDIITKRIDKANAKKHKNGLENLYFYKAEFSEIIEAFDQTEFKLKNIVILFPDPWPKKRHFKNRLMNDVTLETLANRSTEDTTLYYRTDHEGYFDWTLEVLENNKFWKTNKDTNWLFEKETFFQEMMDSYQSLSASLK